MTMLFTHTHIYIYTCHNEDRNIYMFICKKKFKKLSTPSNKTSATTKQLIRRNSICCLKNQAICFHRVHTETGLTPPLSLFVFICCLRIPLPFPLYKEPFIKKVSMQEMEGDNDNASAFMHLDVKANK